MDALRTVQADVSIQEWNMLAQVTRFYPSTRPELCSRFRCRTITSIILPRAHNGLLYSRLAPPGCENTPPSGRTSFIFAPHGHGFWGSRGQVVAGPVTGSPS